jgi:hypothetical protein
MIRLIIASLRVLCSATTAPAPRPAPRPARLGVEAVEDRLVPASVTFVGGVLFVSADQATNDTVLITPTGPAHDGSTGVKLVTNVTGTWTTQKFGGVGNPVTNIALDMKDGNDFVDVASLRATAVYVGEGNGNNMVFLGDTLSGGLVAGNGQNHVRIGGATENLFTDAAQPGIVAGTGVFLGWGYQFFNAGKGIGTTNGIGNNQANTVFMDTHSGESSLVHIDGNGNNRIFGGRGDDSVYIAGNGNNLVREGAGDNQVLINGSGNNSVSVGTGNNTVHIVGDGNNTVKARGSGLITVVGIGKNVVSARHSSNLTVKLNEAGAGSSVTAALTDGIFVDNTQVTTSGTVDNVKVKLVGECTNKVGECIHKD